MTTSKPEAKIRLVVFDWAGTTVDHGCFAPVVPFVEALANFGVQVTIDEAREPMGLGKRDHLKSLLQMPRIGQQWQAKYGRAWTEEDLDRAYHEQFVPRQLASVRDHCELIPGLLETVAWLRERGIKIGTTTGYFGDAARLAYAAAAEQGFRPDHNVTPDEVAAGRPAPWMIYRNMEALGVYPASSVVKIGDTAPDIAEGLNAGVWSIGVTHTGSDVGLSAKDLAALAPAERDARADRARIRLVNTGAHLVIPSIREVPNLISTIERWFAEGELPQKYELKQVRAGKARIPMDDDVAYLLLTPGPLTTTRAVKQAMLRDVSTWDRDYNDIVQDVRARLVRLATPSNPSAAADYTAVLMQGSGTFAVEATLGSIIPRDGKLLVVNNGAYGQRMAEIARRLGIEHITLTQPEIEPADAAAIDNRLGADPRITHVALVHCETTTGMLNPAAAIGEIVRRHDRVFVLDAMSSFAGLPIDISNVRADYLISSANKCVQGVPGFGFVVARRADLERCEGRARSLSLDLFDQWREMESKGGKWRYTSPTHVLLALHQALDELDAEGGVAARAARYAENHRVLVEGLSRLGFRPLLPGEHRSPIITSFLYPRDAGFSFDRMYEALKRRGFVIYPGKVSNADTFRVGTIGHVFPDDFRRLVDCFAEVVREFGWQI